VHASHPILERAAISLRELFYPVRCASCMRFGATLCGACEIELRALRLTQSGRCGNCAAAWKEAGFCPRCQGWGLALDRCLAAFEMSGAPRTLVHRLKYAHHRDVAGVMSRFLQPLADKAFDAATPVPLHPRRERSRGFNQARLILEPLGWPPLPGRLERVRNTRHQVGRHEGERWRGMADAFRYSGPDLTGMNIAVVDDVITTGATVVECARTLKAHGARSVTAIAFARTSYKLPAGGSIED
jgi:ComF family protein